MIFTEYRFLVFFFFVYMIHWLLRKPKRQTVFLLAASYIFYSAWDWRFLALIVISTLVDFVAGRAIAESKTKRIKNAALLTSLTVNLGFLAVFKYFNFFLDSSITFLSWLGFEPHVGTLKIILPVGISFYTFQTLSYSIDIYKGKLKPSNSLLDFAFFVAFFPQLVAGPIVRALDFLPQINQQKKSSQIDYRYYLILFLIGYFKKNVVADNAGYFVDQFFNDPGSFGMSSQWLGAILYAAQIYCDFSGYSDMAIACAGFLGFKLCENFRWPYFATNITEFWRRWHISLSTWLRDYLYIPLGGNRHGTFNTYRNLMLTMLLGGLWHGAAWTFIVWGGMHGIALALHKFFIELPSKAKTKSNSLLRAFLGWFVTMVWVLFAWVLFRAESFEQATNIIQFMTMGNEEASTNLPMKLWLLMFFAFLAHYLASRFKGLPFLTKLPTWAFASIAGAFFALTLAFGSRSYTPFIYFQF